MSRDAIAAALGGYEVGDELGRGSWGVVYAGRHRGLERDVAIKQLAAPFAEDAAVRARFATEGRVLAALDHPHVVPVYDYVEDEGLCLLVMERLGGGTLGERASAAALDARAVVALGLAASAGLHHAHQRGLLHRDVKPDNLLFSNAGILKVGDFGIAKVLGATSPLAAATAEGEVVGTPAFMAPEQIQGGELSPATDVYALATTLYWLLAGRLPFPPDGDLATVLYRRAHEPAQPLEIPGIPPAVAAVVDAALATRADDRTASAEAFGVALASSAADAWGEDWLGATGATLAATGAIADAARGVASARLLETIVARTAPGTELERARAHYASRTWSRAFESLSHVDTATPLPASDLELLADSAYMLGLVDENGRALERAFNAHLEAGEPLRAARCAFWLSQNLLDFGEFGRAAGWQARMVQLIEEHEGECVEQALVLIGEMFNCIFSNDLEGAVAAADRARSIARRFGDRDVFALTHGGPGMILAISGRTREALPLLDEAMVAVTAGETSPMVAGNIYCGAILGCQASLEPRRAQEWTSAMSAWCDQQPDLVAFSGRCRVHRAELMQLGGDWDRALDEARRAAERCLKIRNRMGAGDAMYLIGDVHRLRGELDRAQDAYREASRLGHEPQPGLALLRVAQGRTGDATAAIRRVVEETQGAARVSVLAAAAEIMLIVGETAEAAAATAELEAIALDRGVPMVAALAAYARGALSLAEGDPRAALARLHEARRPWDELDAPYEAARARALMAGAYAALGDADAAELERDAAREVFERLGAAPDLARADLSA